MDMNHYLEVFIDESKEHLQALNENLLMLEKQPEDLGVMNEIFRAAHTLKGMSATMGYNDLAVLTHMMENVLDGIRNDKIQVTTTLLDVIFLAVDHLEAMIDSIEAGEDGKRDVTDVIDKLQLLEKGLHPEEHQTAQEIAATATNMNTSSSLQYDQYERTIIEQSREQGYECFEMKVHLIPDCVLKTARVFMVFEVLEKSGDVIKSLPSVEQLEEEQFGSEFTAALITKDSKADLEKKIMKISEIEAVQIQAVDLTHQHKLENTTDNKKLESSHLDKKSGSTSKTKKKQAKTASKTIRVNIDKLDILMNLFEELVIDKGRLEQISQNINHADLNETVERMSRISGDLQNIILNMRMVPVETVFNRFPKMVRQLAKDLNKKLELHIIGAETELDRTVIDEIGDPIVHLLRNAIDHGIENPEVRLASGKAETGKINLKAYHSGNHVFIEIADDGAGINKQKIINKAIAKEIITSSEADLLTDEQAFDLIMAPGFSTADTISDVSGRGVGLDVVKSTIQSLGGSISITSAEGKGSTFSIQLPLTLSIISALLVEVGNEKYAIPLSSIIETAIIKSSDIMTAHNQPVIDFRGSVVPLVSLQEVFHVENEDEHDSEFVSIVIVRKAEKTAALAVESFIGQQEIVLKSLGNYLTEVFAISGATILGDGQVALIVDCNALIK
ncbi:chemotaxis protein CheA [Lederbergia sp. NSJ-179]|uniref:chemotaxis protein CheA n=1 Tax=Lederbergia sp. NSJ-179 TaxID=2931402 RepID=UPI001FD45584|nr:chemotaxis protein CheA [Lederbergia sp. NSJ-179]MCJ7839660.1 chemotaxis protein CheA [Lederbergia sp. NSJ-179]